MVRKKDLLFQLEKHAGCTAVRPYGWLLVVCPGKKASLAFLRAAT